MSDNRKNRLGLRFLMGFGWRFSVSFRKVEKGAEPGAGYGLGTISFISHGMDRNHSAWRKYRRKSCMEERKVTVYRGSTKDYSPFPRITLQGQWLDSLGFSIGGQADSGM
ncbi:MAG: hypothetical protein NC489_25340 [Ruminococcus flavefaciens]|nr:hypothetical protein [Ruminococcus flavefaciens]